MSFTDTKYTSWTEFWNRLSPLLEALGGAYSPDAYTRIGLWYQNVIFREDHGLKDHPWAELLQPAILGQLGYVETEKERIRFTKP